ncbi:MAG: fumarate hydratase [Candidatus Thermoplasmatota archaeon]|nr:fumarate hydratase [Candidatus Thermoplasmatota archaeon]
MDKEVLSDDIAKMIEIAVTQLPSDIVYALKKARDNEVEPGRTQLSAILENIELAGKEKKPLCQDTGIQTFFVKVGINFPYMDILKDSIVEGVRKATEKVPLRPNAINLLTEKNSGNIGRHVPFIHWELVEGDECEIIAFPKGGGSENMSTLKMLKPGEGLKGAKKFILDWMVNAAGNPCPPTVVGVGIGGGADIAMELAKRSLLRPVGKRNEIKEIAKMEEELIDAINSTGIGPMGLGGKTTVIDVHIEVAHRHPASLPVGIVVQCWADRRAGITINSNGEVKWNMK